jgi:hypothetical protein
MAARPPSTALALRVASAALALALAHDARADGKAACLEAVDQGQSLRQAHRLVEAREQFRVCARPGCPPLVQSDCAGWLEATERSIPTVVVKAKNRAGEDLVEVTVTVDGQPFLTKLDGDARPMNPGDHVFRFVDAASGATLDEQVVVDEGEQNRSVAVVLGKALPAVPAEAPPSPPPPSPPPAVTHPGRTMSGWQTAGWVLGGVGVAGLGAGAVFGFLAASDTSSAHCNAANQCLAGPLSDARTAARVADVGLVAGGILLATGAGLVLFAPRGHEPATAVRVAPVVGRGHEGLAVGGAW